MEKIKIIQRIGRVCRQKKEVCKTMNVSDGTALRGRPKVHKVFNMNVLVAVMLLQQKSN